MDKNITTRLSQQAIAMLSTNVAKYNLFRERERKGGDLRKRFRHVIYISHFYKFQLNFGSSNSLFFLDMAIRVRIF